MKAKRLSFVTAACVAALCTTSFAYTISGTVSDDQGKLIKDVDVSLLKEGKTTKTDDQGKFTIHEDEEEVGINPSFRNAVGYISVNNGILSYSQSSTSPVQVKIYNSLGNQVFKKTLQGSGTYDLSKGLKARGTYFAQVTVGSATQKFKFTTDGSFESSFGSQANALMKDAQKGEAIQFVATDYDTLTIKLNTLDTTLNVKLTKSVPAEQTFKFGYALKNEPRKSKGCGKASSLRSNRKVENGEQFSINVGGKNRTFFITLPNNYDNTKPHKLLIANHCMGSKAEDFVHHNPDYDHPTPYYGQQKLDKNGDYIFVAPQGNDNGTWNGKEDHQFVDEMITTMFDNYCVDTTRVFATGFSFGAMFTNSLAQDLQERLRAVAVYATADYNIWLPSAGTGRYDAKNLPIAWMGVHGKRDGVCNYDRAKTSALPRILKRNGKADANGNFTDASSEKPQEFNGTAGHLCYDFKNVDERFPVKWCSWNGEHQWTAHDGSNTGTGQGWQNTWVPEEAHKFFEQF
ncbi:T9SS type A sorting domain-containing protein [Fibrobacter succinogenes]|uniref:Por secretion system C-terminal sorting domain-containing protein n=1 Tax=Fibrobacter succinogenes TaxID=833 RepID=A0A380S662_FIBSU|nr:T9SS type A sorting domain-containing protein [Fibrobacter succinogenes]PWJ34586.1 putative secreted protein (Por secretion system target) [Fibrobacter succinogenes subsp. elongatus]SUQ24709.1 Por secretion system C-terminal sorting domain-containing protein [Fibrobacter succinogenes]